FWTKTRAQQGERYRIVRTPRGAGLHGVQIPVFGPAGLEGAVSLGGERIDASPPVRLALSLVGTAAFQAARRLFAPAAGEGEGRLSAREREVLSWTAIGRRQADIAAMLGLSERTVENHLRRIRQRLGAATTAQAIGVAIRLGEIAPERR
ncbi:LuxR C-terminal-related transcriptional regulator, partial [Serratia nevei]